MGTDINVAFGHSCEFPPAEALARAMCEGIEEVRPIFQNDWSVDLELSNVGLMRVHATGLSIYFGPHTGIISTGYGWPLSADDMEEASLVSSAAMAIARFFRSPRIIFLPDDIEPWCNVETWISAGATLEDLQSRLAGLKQPSQNFAGAVRQLIDCWEVDGYFVQELNCENG